MPKSAMAGSYGGGCLALKETAVLPSPAAVPLYITTLHTFKAHNGSFTKQHYAKQDC